MQVYYLGVIRSKDGDENGTELCAEKDLSSFSYFTRDEIGKFMSLFSRLIASRTKPGKPQAVEEQGYVFRTYAHPDNVAAVMITKGDYPNISAIGILKEVLEDFLNKHTNDISRNSVPYPELKEILKRAQNPQPDTMQKLQSELDETTVVLHKTIESVLQRGEKIDDLVAKSSDLSTASKAFYKQAKQQNSCCVVM